MFDRKHRATALALISAMLLVQADAQCKNTCSYTYDSNTSIGDMGIDWATAHSAYPFTSESVTYAKFPGCTSEAPIVVLRTYPPASELATHGISVVRAGGSDAT